MISNEIKCHINTSLGLVVGCIPCIPPSPRVRAWPRQWSYMRIWNRLNAFCFLRYAYFLTWCAHANTTIWSYLYIIEHTVVADEVITSRFNAIFS